MMAYGANTILIVVDHSSKRATDLLANDTADR